MTDEKTKLSDYLEAFDEHFGRDDAEIDEAWRSVEAEVFGSPPPPPGTSSASGTGGSGTLATTLSIAAAAAVLLGVVAVSRPSASTLRPVIAAVERPVAAPSKPSPPAQTRVDPAPEPEAPVVVATTTAAPPRPTAKPVSRRRPKLRPKQKPAPPVAESTAEAPTLTNELRLIQQARRALRRGDAQASLAALSRHAKSFPNGSLVQERWATEIQALCKLGRNGDANDAARRYAATYTADRNAARLLSECAAEKR